VTIAKVLLSLHLQILHLVYYILNKEAHRVAHVPVSGFILQMQTLTQEAEIRRIVVPSQPWANSSGNPISKKKITHKKKG
jgi:hypothetical protein